ncbi:kinase-associated lipoprotein B [Peribacillus kribbensis]|uniref:kinase-associated lipoprotein B n=1 Tax=Peribacillus kribbensis TaxID=356658 RepID=UPI00047916DD|nr:kinase-associated lipoprotein B [Peribacillus kribbensis]
MTAEPFSIGKLVKAFYKTGTYIGEITDIRPQGYLVKILAVVKHPIQGDLHNPKQADVQFFHQRRALAYREQTNVPNNMVKEFTGEVPSYTESLKAALTLAMKDLKDKEDPWSKKSLSSLEELETDYFK